MTKAKRHHVKFATEEKVSKPVKLSFEREDGTKVTFPAHKKVTEKVLVDFNVALPCRPTVCTR
jgi:hypothetical protein